MFRQLQCKTDPSAPVFESHKIMQVINTVPQSAGYSLHDFNISAFIYLVQKTSMASTSHKAIWLAAATKKPLRGTLYIRCNVKPGASKAREGVTSVDADAIEVCVSAQAREGEANKAVVRLFSEVSNHSLAFCHYL